jgi:hypothetical protein
VAPGGLEACIQAGYGVKASFLVGAVAWRVIAMCMIAVQATCILQRHKLSGNASFLRKVEQDRRQFPPRQVTSSGKDQQCSRLKLAIRFMMVSLSTILRASLAPRVSMVDVCLFLPARTEAAPLRVLRARASTVSQTVPGRAGTQCCVRPIRQSTALVAGAPADDAGWPSNWQWFEARPASVT